MSLEQELFQRSRSQCELCGSKEDLQVFAIPNSPEGAEKHILICGTCKEQIEDPEKTNSNYWRSLNDSMWSTVPAVQVMAWRMLNRLRGEGWPQDLLDMMYMEEDQLAWAQTGQKTGENSGGVVHTDSNGVTIEAGDTVVLIKDLPVRGSSLVAKRGTSVRRISLVYDNPEQIEGKVEGRQIVILAKFVKVKTKARKNRAFIIFKTPHRFLRPERPNAYLFLSEILTVFPELFSTTCTLRFFPLFSCTISRACWPVIFLPL